MLFNSIEFVLFFPLVLILYWGIFSRSSVKGRNAFLLVASYFFYGWWDFRFLGLIFISSLVDFLCGKYIFRAQTKHTKQVFLGISLLTNLGILFFFKYYGFFADELIELASFWDVSLSLKTLNIILPVGISFYTFQTLSYTIDIYRKRLEPTNDILAFFTFVSFFPQLVAGPIERAKHLLPQFYTLKRFDYQLASNGFRQLLWGFFAKIAVADSVAPLVNSIFENHEQMGAETLILGAILFSIQIYGDFAGYSNIAIGTASILGFDLMQNFNNPYFSRNIREFWTRWHISLSTWFRDYIYIPLGGNRCSSFRHAFNVMATFILSGLWHGANWTFVIWGTIHGALYLITKPFSHSVNSDRIKLNQSFSIVVTFAFVAIAFVFFRAQNIEEAGNYLMRIIHFKDGKDLLHFAGIKTVLPAFFFSFVLFFTEWIQREKKHGLDLTTIRTPVRHLIYYALILAILFSFQTDRIFIYFQF